MRFAILNSTSQPMGGVGSYLGMVIPALARRGHDLAFWHEFGPRPSGDPFALPPGTPSWSVEQLGRTRALDELRAWRPDLLISHGLADPSIEGETLEIAPAVLQLHGYHGTCISGLKTFKYPVIVPCSRQFGWPCLVHYLPRHCGGLSPLTMVREYRRQSQRLQLLSRYRARLVYSAHLEREFARHGLETTCIGPPTFPAPVVAGDRADQQPRDERQLVFLGRMDPVKGGGYLIDALPQVVAALGRPVHVSFAGNGPARGSWQVAAGRLMSRQPRVRIEFRDWLDRQGVGSLLARADLLVMPSLWPEPFGLVGLEAARSGVPVAAFAVGGIPDWLRPGVNGFLAPGDPPTADGLARAIVECLKDPAVYRTLCDGAARVAKAVDLGHHLDALIQVLARVTHVTDEVLLEAAVPRA